MHGGLIPITKEGVLVAGHAMTGKAAWLSDEIKNRFNVSMKYVGYTHANADHISGDQVFQPGDATVAVSQRGLEPIVGAKISTALSNRVFDRNMRVVLNGETVLSHRVTPSHSDAMIMVQFFRIQGASMSAKESRCLK